MSRKKLRKYTTLVKAICDLCETRGVIHFSQAARRSVIPGHYISYCPRCSGYKRWNWRTRYAT